MPTVVGGFLSPRTSITMVVGGGLFVLALLQANLLSTKKCDYNKPNLSKSARNEKDVTDYNLSCLSRTSHQNLNGTFGTDKKFALPNSKLVSKPTAISKPLQSKNCSIKSDFLDLLFTDSICLHLIVNSAFCYAFVALQFIIQFVFGNLRPEEVRQLRGRFGSLFFFKLMFLFGVMDVEKANEFLMWTYWFTIIALLVYISTICKLRFNFLSHSPSTSFGQHSKIIGLLLFSMLLLCVLTESTSVFTSSFLAMHWNKKIIHVELFMITECILVMCIFFHLLGRYFIYLYDIQQRNVWERKAVVIHYFELFMNFTELCTKLLHFLHMIFYTSAEISVTLVILTTQLIAIFRELIKQYRRHSDYRKAIKNIKQRFPQATTEDLKNNEDRCAICWDEMSSACKLPCGHLYHSSCIRTWLERETTCPTCRAPLEISPSTSRFTRSLHNLIGLNQHQQPVNQSLAGNAENGYYWLHFDGSNFASWIPRLSMLPRLSIHISQTPRGTRAIVSAYLANRNETPRLSNDRLQAMTRDVLEVLPETSPAVVENDLRLTRSVQATIMNILDGHAAPANLNRRFPFVRIGSPDEPQPLHPTNSRNEHQPPQHSTSDPSNHQPDLASSLDRPNSSATPLTTSSGSPAATMSSSRSTIFSSFASEIHVGSNRDRDFDESDGFSSSEDESWNISSSDESLD